MVRAQLRPAVPVHRDRLVRMAFVLTVVAIVAALTTTGTAQDIVVWVQGPPLAALEVLGILRLARLPGQPRSVARMWRCMLGAVSCYFLGLTLDAVMRLYQAAFDLPITYYG